LITLVDRDHHTPLLPCVGAISAGLDFILCIGNFLFRDEDLFTSLLHSPYVDTATVVAGESIDSISESAPSTPSQAPAAAHNEPSAAFSLPPVSPVGGAITVCVFNLFV